MGFLANLFGIEKETGKLALLHKTDKQLHEEITFLISIEETLQKLITLVSEYDADWNGSDMKRLFKVFKVIKKLEKNEEKLIKRFKKRLNDARKSDDEQGVEELGKKIYGKSWISQQQNKESWNYQQQQIRCMSQYLRLPDKPLQSLLSFLEEKGPRINQVSLEKDCKMFLEVLHNFSEILKLDEKNMKNIEIKLENLYKNEKTKEQLEKNRIIAKGRVIDIVHGEKLYFHFTSKIRILNLLRYGTVSRAVSQRAFTKDFTGFGAWDKSGKYVCFYSFYWFIYLLKKALRIIVSNEGWNNSDYGKKGLIIGESYSPIKQKILYNILTGISKSEKEWISNLISYMNIDKTECRWFKLDNINYGLQPLRTVNEFNAWISSVENNMQWWIERSFNIFKTVISMGVIFKKDIEPNFLLPTEYVLDDPRAGIFEVHLNKRLKPKEIIGLIFTKDQNDPDFSFMMNLAQYFALPLYDIKGKVIWPRDIMYSQNIVMDKQKPSEIIRKAA